MEEVFTVNLEGNCQLPEQSAKSEQRYDCTEACSRRADKKTMILHTQKALIFDAPRYRSAISTGTLNMGKLTATAVGSLWNGL
jgi:hypothetical protein